MKNSIYKLGIVSCAFIILAIIFKLNRYYLAGTLFTVSIALFSMVYIPLAFKKVYKKKPGELKWFYIITFVTVEINLIAMLWTFMHWPESRLFIYAAIGSILILFLPAFLFHFRGVTRTSSTAFFYIMVFVVYVSVMDAMLSINPKKEIVENEVKLQHDMELLDDALIKYD